MLRFVDDENLDKTILEIEVRGKRSVGYAKACPAQRSPLSDLQAGFAHTHYKWPRARAIGWQHASVVSQLSCHRCPILHIRFLPESMFPNGGARMRRSIPLGRHRRRG
jgi:hypothetical protein